jgi:hypothetical protein
MKERLAVTEQRECFLELEHTLSETVLSLEPNVSRHSTVKHATGTHATEIIITVYLVAFTSHTNSSTKASQKAQVQQVPIQM